MGVWNWMSHFSRRWFTKIGTIYTPYDSLRNEEETRVCSEEPASPSFPSRDQCDVQVAGSQWHANWTPTIFIPIEYYSTSHQLVKRSSSVLGSRPGCQRAQLFPDCWLSLLLSPGQSHPCSFFQAALSPHLWRCYWRKRRICVSLERSAHSWKMIFFINFF